VLQYNVKAHHMPSERASNGSCHDASDQLSTSP
jgi:hypothetical protein